MRAETWEWQSCKHRHRLNNPTHGSEALTTMNAHAIKQDRADAFNPVLQTNSARVDEMQN